MVRPHRETTSAPSATPWSTLRPPATEAQSACGCERIQSERAKRHRCLHVTNHGASGGLCRNVGPARDRVHDASKLGRARRLGKRCDQDRRDQKSGRELITESLAEPVLRVTGWPKRRLLGEEVVSKLVCNREALGRAYWCRSITPAHDHDLPTAPVSHQCPTATSVRFGDPKPHPQVATQLYDINGNSVSRRQLLG